jgi:hypothetical protein
MRDKRLVQLHPEEATHRSSQIACDLAYIVAKYVDTVSVFVSKKELLDIQMQTIFVLMDLLGATSNMDPDVVLDQCKLYFSRLKRSEFNNAPKG